MLTSWVFEGADATPVDDPSQISDHLSDPGQLVWLDLTDPTAADYAVVEEEFSLHPLAMEDARKRGQRPKIDVYPGHAFIVAYAFGGDPGSLHEVHLFVGPGWLITIRDEPRHAPRTLQDLMLERFQRTRGSSCAVGFLTYVALDIIVDTYFDAVDQAQEELGVIEEAIFPLDPPAPGAAEAPTDGGLNRRMLVLRNELVQFRRRVVPMREVVLSVLRREVPWIDDAELAHVQDVLDHLLRILDEIDTLRELLGNAVDAHLALVSNDMNEIMKKMTSWGAILLGSTLVAGIYGMNFDNMPELHYVGGYYAALGIMLALTVGLYVYFKRKGWL